MSGDPEARELSDVVQGLLADAIHDNDGAMLTRYVAIAEVIDRTGERALWLLGTGGMKAWESIGFLEYARDLERSGGDA